MVYSERRNCKIWCWSIFINWKNYRTRKMSNERKIKLPHVILTNCDGAEFFFGVTGA
jgi:hypothetical protein